MKTHKYRCAVSLLFSHALLLKHPLAPVMRRHSFH